MIKSFRSKPLKIFWTEKDARLLPAPYAGKIHYMLLKLEYAQQVPDDFEGTNWHIHLLKGNLHGYWSLTVSRNYRIVFRFENGHAYDVDYIDYH